MIDVVIDTDDAPLDLETEGEVDRRIREEPPTGEPPAGQGQEPAAETPRQTRRLPLLLAALVLLLAAIESGAMLVQHAAAPTEADWKAAAEKIRSERRPDEPVLFAPLWVEPLGRLHLGDQIDMELLLLSDVDRHRRLFEISIRGAQHPWIADKKLRATDQWTFGAVRVALYQQSRVAEVLYDFTRKIQEARVSRIGRDVVPCPWSSTKRRFTCDPARRWNWVGPHLAEVDHRPHRCIYMHAVDHEVMRATFPAARVGTTLAGYTGIDDFENRKRSDAPVLLKVFIGPREAGAIQHQNAWRWHRFSIDTTSFSGQTHPVSFEVTSPKAFARVFCFAAETRK